MKFTVIAYENIDADFWHPYKPGDQIALIDSFTVEAPTVADAPDALYPVGNKMEPDADGKDWPRNHRSMSIGDVVAVVTPDGDVYFACASMGWDKIERPIQ